jgi:NAD-dependent dihydropyrimidine dehydrogenase PreA subunit
MRADKTDCKRDPGEIAPQINRNRCEGKAACVEVCPYDVFEIRMLPHQARSSLTLKGKIKGLVHGWRQAFAVRADACRACGLCVSICPEKAIVLRRIGED